MLTREDGQEERFFSPIALFLSWASNTAAALKSCFLSPPPPLSLERACQAFEIPRQTLKRDFYLFHRPDVSTS